MKNTVVAAVKRLCDLSNSTRLALGEVVQADGLPTRSMQASRSFSRCISPIERVVLSQKIRKGQLLLLYQLKFIRRYIMPFETSPMPSAYKFEHECVANFLYLPPTATD